MEATCHEHQAGRAALHRQGRRTRDRRGALAGPRDGDSRAVLLRGAGGIGKTSIVRHLALVSPDPATDWVRPIDADDPEVWLLSNLERRIVRQIDPGGRYFGPYLEHLSRLDSYPRGGLATRR